MAEPTIQPDDLRAAVASGMISEAQAVSITVLAQDRAGTRKHMTATDEPFELFKGFNEIFIVIGLCILYSGWIGLSGLGMITSRSPGNVAVMLGLISMIVCVGLAQYFTIKRRMIAPSILLTGMFAAASFQTILSAVLSWDIAAIWNAPVTLAICAGGTALLLLGYFLIFRVPFTLALIMVSSFVALLAATSTGQSAIPNVKDLFLLSADGPFAFVTLGLGLTGLCFALYFDLSDPHRLTRRADNAFWLHVLAAPAIVNTIALTLFTSGGLIAYPALIVFVLMMACFAMVIDRRSFLISAVGYVVALGIAVTDGVALITLLLGTILVYLGAKWESIRSGLMRALPEFRGKDRLPPYTLLTQDDRDDTDTAAL